MLDSGFLKRVYRTSTAVWLFVLLWCAALRSTSAAIGVTIGFAISFGSLVLVERLVKALFPSDPAQQSRRSVAKLLILAFVKYAIIGVVLWGALRFGIAKPAGIAIGLGLPTAVIALKALGIVLTPHTQSDRRN